MNSIESLAFVFPLRADKTQEWRAWIREILGPRRSEYEAFSRKLGLKTQRAYLQLQTSQDPFAVWGRQHPGPLRWSRLDTDRPGIALPIRL